MSDIKEAKRLYSKVTKTPAPYLQRVESAAMEVRQLCVKAASEGFPTLSFDFKDYVPQPVGFSDWEEKNHYVSSRIAFLDHIKEGGFLVEISLDGTYFTVSGWD